MPQEGRPAGCIVAPSLVCFGPVHRPDRQLRRRDNTKLGGRTPWSTTPRSSHERVYGRTGRHRRQLPAADIRRRRRSRQQTHRSQLRRPVGGRLHRNGNRHDKHGGEQSRLVRSRSSPAVFRSDGRPAEQLCVFLDTGSSGGGKRMDDDQLFDRARRFDRRTRNGFRGIDECDGVAAVPQRRGRIPR